jgi:ADP-ribosyl-[dinitrogen reductase] hydrolase
VEANGEVDERDFLTRLATTLPRMRGVGPTTQAAVRRFLLTGELHAAEGSSIGAAMRALPFGWATPVAAAEHRRELTFRLSRTTHGAADALTSAGVVAELAAWAIEQHPLDVVVAAGLREAQNLAQWWGLSPHALRPLWQAANGDWPAPNAGIASGAVTTLASVLHVLQQATDLASAMKHAVALGGDTDTAAATVGGILGCRSEDVETAIPWLPKVILPELQLVEATATGLHDLRRSRCP